MSRPAAICLLVLLAGCGTSPALTRQYQAERSFWRTAREHARLSIRPELVEPEQWRALTDRFLAIGDTYLAVPADPDSSAEGRAARRTRRIAAQALRRAGALAVAGGDTARAFAIFERVETEVDDLPGVSAGGTLAKAGLLEAQGRAEDAADAYQSIVDRVDPTVRPDDSASLVIELPLQIARLRSSQLPEGADRSPLYTGARAYYLEHLDDDAITRYQCRSRLVDIASDLGRWQDAVDQMQILEKELAVMEDPPEDPGKVRLGIAETQRLGLRDWDAGARTLEGLLEEYPRSPVVPQALLALAQYHGGHDDVDEALRHLNRLESGHPNAKDIRAEAQLYRGRLLERHDRWGEALEVFRSLPIDHPLSEAALWSHLEIAGHYERTGNAEGMQSALRDAENAFRGVVDRYPSETLTLSAREKLAQVLMIQERYGEAVEELTGLATALRGTLRGARQLAMAAQVYELKLEDGDRALELYRRAVDWYPGTEFASAAAEAADRLSEETDR